MANSAAWHGGLLFDQHGGERPCEVIVRAAVPQQAAASRQFREKAARAARGSRRRGSGAVNIGHYDSHQRSCFGGIRRYGQSDCEDFARHPRRPGRIANDGKATFSSDLRDSPDHGRGQFIINGKGLSGRRGEHPGNGCIDRCLIPSIVVVAGEWDAPRARRKSSAPPQHELPKRITLSVLGNSAIVTWTRRLLLSRQIPGSTASPTRLAGRYDEVRARDVFSQLTNSPEHAEHEQLRSEDRQTSVRAPAHANQWRQRR